MVSTSFSPVTRLAILSLAVMILLDGHAAETVCRTENLLEMDLEALLNVEISVASKKQEAQIEAPGVVVVVPHEEFKVYGDRNLHQLLQRQPSVYTRGSYMYPNNIAAFRGDMPTHLDLHNLILINGRPIRESGFGGINFPAYMAFPLNSLDSVELIRGPGSVLYGTNAFTGVINLRYRVPDHNELVTQLVTGSYGYRQLDITAGGRSGQLGYVMGLRAGGQDGYDYSLTDEKGAWGTHADDNSYISGSLHLEYGRLTFDFFGVDLTTFHLGPLPWWSLPYHRFSVNKLFANVCYWLPLEDRTRLEFNLTYNLHENAFANVTRTVGLNSSDVLGEVTLFAKPMDRMDLVLGFLQEYRTNYKPKEGYYQSIPPYCQRPSSAYAQADYVIARPVKITVGTQWNRSAQGYEDFVSRGGLVLTPFKRWGAKLLVGEAFRAPFAIETDLYDIPILVGNNKLRPEQVRTYDVQVFYDDEKTFAAITYFNSTINGLIIRDTSVNPASFKNGGEQQFEGLEFELKRFLTPHWHILGSAMYQDSRQTTDLNPSTSPHFMFKLGSAYTWSWGTAVVFYSHFSKPPRLPTEVVVNPEPDALNLLSFNLQLDPYNWLGCKKGRVLMTIKVENALDQDIWVPEFNRAGHPNSLPDGPGVTAYAGLTLRY
ncbi:MAG: TonB-dependent receptor [Sedimentisphaerales bacterium]|nr:TonB-dependent receptor [Sedimentisphaerales bacterium]